MKFSMNGLVKVRLTDLGRTIHRERHEQMVAEVNDARRGSGHREVSWPYVPPEEDADGWSTWQLWQLMSSFGAHVGLGFPSVFVTTEIEIVEGTS